MEVNPGFFLTKSEVNSMKELLEKRMRADGRSQTDVREISIEFSDSASVIKLGSTIVSCKITKKEALADEDRPNQGFFSVGLSTSQKLDPDFRTETLNSIRDIIKKNNALDIESLVIKMGQLVWDLRAEIVILENDGGLYEAMTFAVIIALLSTKLPSTREPKPLVMHHLPIPVTFAFLDDHFYFLDPTVIEAAACNGFMTIFADAQGEICAIHKNGGVPISSTIMAECIDIAMDVSKYWHKSIMDQMGDDAPPLLKNLTQWRDENEEIVEIIDEEKLEENVHGDASREEEKIEEGNEEGPADIEGLMAFL